MELHHLVHTLPVTRAGQLCVWPLCRKLRNRQTGVYQQALVGPSITKQSLHLHSSMCVLQEYTCTGWATKGQQFSLHPLDRIMSRPFVHSLRERDQQYTLYTPTLYYTNIHTLCRSNELMVGHVRAAMLCHIQIAYCTVYRTVSGNGSCQPDHAEWLSTLIKQLAKANWAS